MNLNFVLLTKCYDKYDLKYWLEYHHNRFRDSRFTIVDNESIVDVKRICDDILGSKKYRYIRINGFPDQKKLYGDLMNDQYGHIFWENEAVAFFDDDEFFYLHDPNADDKDFDYVEVLENAFEYEKDYEGWSWTKYDCLCIPHLNMSSETLLDDRNTSASLPMILDKRRDDRVSTVKPIVRYSSSNEYEWKIQPGVDEAGHVPFVNGKRNAAVFTAWYDKKKAQVVAQTWPLDNTSFAEVDYSSNVRLYHYHLKSKWDWDQKIKRGSCSSKIPWYSEKIEENCFYGHYDYVDQDMKSQFSAYVKPELQESMHETWSAVEENDTTRRATEFKEESKSHHRIGYEDFRFATGFEDKRTLGRRWLLENAPHLHVEDPENLADLIAHGKLYDMNPKKVLWADKCAVYKELYDLGLESIRIPVLYEKYKPTDLDIREAIDCYGARNDCILKCNHGSGYNIRFNALEGVNTDFLVKKIRTWLDTNYAYIAGYEWHYEPIVPAILVQPSLTSRDVVPLDYQFYCCDGEIVAIDIQRKLSKVLIEHLAFTDADGKDLDWCLGSWPLQHGLGRDQMEAVEAMKPVVKRISSLFKFVRVDLFWINKRIYFCETTFCPSSGVLDYQTRNK